MRSGAIIQARMGSTRLPGKVLAELGGRPMLEQIIRRLRAATTLEWIGVATTVDAGDDAIAGFCASRGISCFRGSVDDLLDRYVQAALAWELDPVVRITGDCPFVDPRVVDALVRAQRETDADYVTFSEKTVHEGIDPFSLGLLRRFHARDLTAEEREHPVLIARSHPDSVRVLEIPADPAHRHRPGLSLSVDEPRELEFAREVYATLGEGDRIFDTGELLALLDRRPDLVPGATGPRCSAPGATE